MAPLINSEDWFLPRAVSNYAIGIAEAQNVTSILCVHVWSVSRGFRPAEADVSTTNGSYHITTPRPQHNVHIKSNVNDTSCLVVSLLAYSWKLIQIKCLVYNTYAVETENMEIIILGINQWRLPTCKKLHCCQHFTAITWLKSNIKAKI